MALIDQITTINKNEFTDDFLRKYFELGFGSLSKHDIDLLVYYLVKEHSDLFNGKTNYEISSLLTITERKLQSIQMESYLRYENNSISKNLEELSVKITKGEIKPEVEGDKIRVLIDSPVLRRDLEYSITSLGHIVDYSFNKNILSLRLSNFFEVFGNLNIENGKELKTQVIDFFREQNKWDKEILIEIENKSWWIKQFNTLQAAVKKEAAALIFHSIISMVKSHIGI